MPEFGARLDEAFGRYGHLCLGIDPHPFLLESWGLPDTPDGLRRFGLRAVDAAAGTIGVVKPQVAFFERHGSAGYAALEAVHAAARAAGLLVIADAKRGDIGSTLEAYGQAWLTPGSPLEADAMTLSPFQGVGALESAVQLAGRGGKGVFVLAATSNPESRAVQLATGASGATVAAAIVGEVDALNVGDRLGSVGVVLGATVRFDDFGIDRSLLATTPILAPGFGEQGAALTDLPALYGDAAVNVIANVGRALLRLGPDGLREGLLRESEALARAGA
jgi:orotidine-5'-phosphate decarboxylase